MQKLACHTLKGQFIRIKDEYQEIIKVKVFGAEVLIRTLTSEHHFGNHETVDIKP